MDLLKGLLEKDPSKRMKANDALNHEFMKPISNIEVSSFKDRATLLSLNNIV